MSQERGYTLELKQLEEHYSKRVDHCTVKLGLLEKRGTPFHEKIWGWLNPHYVNPRKKAERNKDHAQERLNTLKTIRSINITNGDGETWQALFMINEGKNTHRLDLYSQGFAQYDFIYYKCFQSRLFVEKYKWIVEEVLVKAPSHPPSGNVE